MTRVEFVVEEAGCASCAERVRSALEPLGAVEHLEVDEAADQAAVTLAPTRELSQSDVADALARASAGAGHTYRVRDGSWAATD